MSVLIVDDEHIAYLMAVGLYAADYKREWEWADGKGNLRWFHNGVDYGLTPENTGDVGQMLKDANMAAFQHYWGHAPEDGDGFFPLDNIQKPERVFHEELGQILKALDTYCYQVEESPDWNDSQAKAFTDSLRREVIRAFTGYERAEWGTPARGLEFARNATKRKLVSKPVKRKRKVKVT